MSNILGVRDHSRNREGFSKCLKKFTSNPRELYKSTQPMYGGFKLSGGIICKSSLQNRKKVPHHKG